MASIDPGITDWIGTVQSHEWGGWIDTAFLLLLGGIPWQSYYQRVLSSKTSKRAMLLSYGGGIIALIMTVPSVIFKNTFPYELYSFLYYSILIGTIWQAL